jgi:hypothetical protein
VHLPNSISLPRESLLILFNKTGDEEFLETEQDEIVTTEIIIIMKYVFMIESFKMNNITGGQQTTDDRPQEIIDSTISF